MRIMASQIAELRMATGAGYLDCKKALDDSAGDHNTALDLLRAKGAADASRKAERQACEGMVCSYLHAGGKIGVMVEINCETDFVARTEAFQSFARSIAMQIAATDARYLCREDVPVELVEHERAIYRARAVQAGKPDGILDRIVAGQLDRFFGELCLLEQRYIRDSEKTVQSYLSETVASLGESIKVRRFVKFVMGEGLAKRECDFAAEVSAALS